MREQGRYTVEGPLGECHVLEFGNYSGARREFQVRQGGRTVNSFPNQAAAKRLADSLVGNEPPQAKR